ncbi:hypothetical protein B0T16DRAFT_386098 [Cercophora newfieldiana]|uniref:Uncharacterized protein n=1 Tax=Cercophora newfieldiana TaxID=92897 RepID=A0AA39YS29_9PEZI|nr:hypothetical protein B0T16DRAFT_386098 [Cercophora newfieldiana]
MAGRYACGTTGELAALLEAIISSFSASRTAPPPEMGGKAQACLLGEAPLRRTGLPAGDRPALSPYPFGAQPLYAPRSTVDPQPLLRCGLPRPAPTTPESNLTRLATLPGSASSRAHQSRLGRLHLPEIQFYLALRSNPDLPTPTLLLPPHPRTKNLQNVYALHLDLHLLFRHNPTTRGMFQNENQTTQQQLDGIILTAPSLYQASKEL